MNPTEQAARWLADEPCFDLRQTRTIATMQQEVSGEWMRYDDALAAIVRHLAPGDDLVAQATAALEGVTEGPWEAVFNRQTWGWVEVDGPSFKIGAPTQATDLSLADEVQRKKDARFIAFARQWVPEAAARISALTAICKMHSGVITRLQDCVSAAEDENATLRDRLARMEGERDEWARKAGGGCDAANGEDHTVIRQGTYSFCAKCGESLKGVRFCHEPRAALADGGKHE